MKTREFFAKIKDGEIKHSVVDEKQLMAGDVSKEKVYEIFKNAGVTDTQEEFFDALKEIYEEMSVELSDDELDLVAGGGWKDTLGAIGVVAAKITIAILLA